MVAGIDVANELRARGGAVGAQGFLAVPLFFAAEEQVPAVVREGVGVTPIPDAGPNVASALRPRGGAVGAPELVAVGAVVGAEEQGPADVGQVAGVRSSAAAFD